MRTALLLAMTLCWASICLGAESYPARPVRVVAPFAPGGIVDVTARLISQELSQQLGKPFIVDNRAGGSGTIGNALVARATPDGYTLLLMDSSATIVPSVMKSLPYDIAKSFAAITEIAEAPQVMVVAPSLNVKTLKEFIALAQANPGKFNFGSGGTGGTTHLSAELFKMAAKVNLVHVPFKGGGEMVTAMMSGQIQMFFSPLPTVLGPVKNGALRALAVTTNGKRSPLMPDVPSMSEAGLPGMVVYAWYGLVGPAGIPKDIVNKLHLEVVKALRNPALIEKFGSMGAELIGDSPEEFGKTIRNDLKRWAEVVKFAGITPE